jgi:hypothetical protein
MKDNELTKEDKRELVVLAILCALIMGGAYVYVLFIKSAIPECQSNTPVPPGKSCLDRATGTVKSDRMWNEELNARAAQEATSGD